MNTCYMMGKQADEDTDKKRRRNQLMTLLGGAALGAGGLYAAPRIAKYLQGLKKPTANTAAAAVTPKPAPAAVTPSLESLTPTNKIIEDLGRSTMSGNLSQVPYGTRTELGGRVIGGANSVPLAPFAKSLEKLPAPESKYVAGAFRKPKDVPLEAPDAAAGPKRTHLPSDRYAAGSPDWQVL